eukprot:6196658-Pleurochrysis_carterae.AAC.2
MALSGSGLAARPSACFLLPLSKPAHSSSSAPLRRVRTRACGFAGPPTSPRCCRPSTSAPRPCHSPAAAALRSWSLKVPTLRTRARAHSTVSRGETRR